MIIVFGGKGGSGKSTFVRNLGVEWMRLGFTVVIIDADPQGTVMSWYAVAQQRSQVVPRAFGANAKTIESLVSKVASRVDLVLIDTPGRIEHLHLLAMHICDVVVLPCKPQPDDVRALQHSIDAVEFTRSKRVGRPALQALVVINEKRKSNIITESITAIKRIAKDKSLPMAATELKAFNDYVSASGVGMVVTTLSPSSEASRQMRELAAELESTIHGFPTRPEPEPEEEEDSSSFEAIMAAGAVTAEEGGI